VRLILKSRHGRPGSLDHGRILQALRGCVLLATLVFCLVARAQSVPNYEGLWWAAPAGSESGWGINFAHQGDVIFATWFTYDVNGKAWWLSATASKTAAGVYSGTLYQTSGPAFNTVPFDPNQVTRTGVGTGTLTFNSTSTGTFAYTVNGVAQTKTIALQQFGPLPTCTWSAKPNFAVATNYQDLWWVAPAGMESGWGVNLTHQGNTIFATWFTYDANHNPLWYSVTAPQVATNTFSGSLVQTSGPAFSAVPFDPTKVQRTTVGTSTFSFTDGNAGTFAYNVNGVTQTKNITRELFQPPAGTVCEQATTDVIVNFVTTAATPLNPGFNGFNNNLKNAVEYYDTNFQQILTTLSPGWLRFPGGTDSEAFDWASGEIVSAWIDALASNAYQHDINAAAQPVVAGKGGASFSDFADMATMVGGAKILVSVNAFTDTPQSARAFAQYALTNHIQVAAWELANEPYTWIKSGAFFTDATDYATKMKPYRDAIKAADPNAVVALYFSEAGHPDAAWDNALASYSPKYWDAVTYHEYVYPGNLTTFDDLMAAANGNLFSNTTGHVTDYLMPRNNSGVTYLISEVSPSDGHGGVLLGTLYGGIYSAEFALRMSTLPQVKYVASFQMLSNAGIEETNENLNVVDAAYNSGTTINTSGLNFGFFLSAQGAGEAVANGALHNSVGVYATTTTGGPTASTAGGGSIPAVYAQAYEGGNGKRYVVLTNKGALAAVAQIMQDGIVRTNQMQMTFVTGTDPSVANTNSRPNNVQIQTQTVTTPGAVTIPPYSVERLEW
jgi:hypothetical protein